MNDQKTVASFSLETAVDDCIRTYTGGLGVVHGSHIRAAYQKLPLVAVSILWQCGNYDQRLGSCGMEVEYVKRDYRGYLTDTGCKINIALNDNNVWLKAWELKPEVFKTAPLYLLDADIEENNPHVRTFTESIYNGGEEKRIAHEIIIGIGGVRMLQALRIPVGLYHFNEGHTVLAGIELLRQEMEKGLSFEEALKAVREKIVGTTHTPVSTGGESYGLDLKMRLGAFPGLNREQAFWLGGDPFNSTVAMLKMAKLVNAVSRLHAETANQIWAWVDGRCPIIPITNGVDVPFWQMPEFQGEKTIDEIREAKRGRKKILLDYVKEKTGKIFREDVLTIVWARRWADYKRPWLVFRDWNWFEALLNSGKIQIIFAGKPHPADTAMRDLWNNVWRASQRYSNLAILPGYELSLMQLLRNGADIWLNTPRRPREACGTSWMSAMMDCALVMSTRDGGVLEALTPDNGFPFGVDFPSAQEWDQDNKDSEDLKQNMERALDIFYNDKTKWYVMALAAKKEAETNFSAERMVRDYAEKLYV